jgi:precorrin-6B methylase 2
MRYLSFSHPALVKPSKIVNRTSRKSGIILEILILSLLPASAVPAAVSASQYEFRRAGPDGIGKFYFNREIAQVMGYEGADWLERPGRKQQERPDLLVNELHLASGMTVADVGAGSGYISKRLAAVVSPGNVLAVDVQPQMVEMLRDLSRKEGTTNIVPILGTASDPKLPAGALDLAIMVDVYHELEFPREMISHICDSLKTGGKLVLVEYRGEDAAVPIKALHKTTVAQVRLELEQFPLTFDHVDERLPIQHIIFFRRTGR